MKSNAFHGLTEESQKARSSLSLALRNALRLTSRPGRPAVASRPLASAPLDSAMRRGLVEDPFRTVHLALQKGSKLDPRAAAAFTDSKIKQARAELLTQDRARKAGGAGARILAAQFLLAEPMLAPQLTRRLADASLMTVSERQRVLNSLERAQRQISADARIAARIALAQDMPLKVAIFLAEQRIKASQTVLDMLMAWGESLREQAKLDQKASERAHREAQNEARNRRTALENKLRLAHRHLAITATPSAHEMAALSAVDDNYVVLSPAMTAATLRGRNLLLPPANGFLHGAFVEPLRIGYNVGGGQNAFTQQILAAGI